MTNNVAPQEISAEASSRADGEAGTAKKPGATASTQCQTGEAETPCGAAPLCPYCTSDNEGIRSTYYDQTCEGCVTRMGQ